MKTPSFFHENPYAQIAIQREADAWIGTPFRENSAVKGAGGGVSCHNLVAELYFEAGFLDRFPVPKGSVKKLRNGPHEALIGYVDDFLGQRFAVVDPAEEEVYVGDLIVMRDARALCHLGVCTSRGWFTHVLPRLGVLRSMLNDATFERRITHIRRPKP